MRRISIISVIFCKKGNKFWVLYFRRVVIFGGIATFTFFHHFRGIVTFGRLRLIFSYFLSQKTYFRGIRTLFVKWKWALLYLPPVYFIFISHGVQAPKWPDAGNRRLRHTIWSYPMLLKNIILANIRTIFSREPIEGNNLYLKLLTTCNNSLLYFKFKF